MKTLSVTEVARNFSQVLHAVERDREEIVLVRNGHRIARLVAKAQRQDAMALDEKTADALSKAVASNRRGRRGRVSRLKNPCAG